MCIVVKVKIMEVAGDIDLMHFRYRDGKRVIFVAPDMPEEEVDQIKEHYELLCK